MRRLSFAVLAASDPDDVYRELASELFGAFAPDQVHLTRLAQDRTVARATEYRPGAGGEPRAHSEYVQQLSERSAVGRVMESGLPLNEPDAPTRPPCTPASPSATGRRAPC